MGKQRKGGNVRKKEITNRPTKIKKHQDDYLHSSLLDPTDRNFIYDEVDEFEDNRDLVPLQQAKKMMEKREVSREQVLGIDGSSSDEDDYDDDDDDDDLSKDSSENDNNDPDELYMEDDIVDEPKFVMPDERAWGNKKHRYFGTDTTDEKIQWKLYNQDEEMAQLEEETARKLQERMAAELKDLVSDDLILQADEKDKAKDDEVKEDLVETDVSTLSRSRKLQLLKRESPEFLPIIEDLKSKCEELRCILYPLMQGIKMGKVPEGHVRQYITTKYRLVLNYVSMISMYMMVKCSSKSVRDHPVVGRLAQYRQLLQELEPCDNKLALPLGKLLNDISEDKETAVKSPPRVEKERPRKRKKELKLLSKNKSAKVEEKKKLMSLLKDPVELDDKKNKSKRKEENVMEASSDEEQEIPEIEKVEKKELDPDEKRAIGYGIAKNKGLMPYRKKDQRNPRVRYRNKYVKKLKRRKGQVQGVRKEVVRYEGEMTGIKSHTIKSVKIKS